ncbi:MAG TPA: hypothetical protein VFV33_09110 [Gemmatimonadaceae bacterium]|nr:hypothetical protein [Gemmatimonadaceae bacterium]
MRFAPAFCLPLVVALACGRGERPAADTAVATPAPAALAEADIAGTWTGTAKAEGSDSVMVHWTQVCANGACAGTSQEAPTDTIPSTYRIEGDSAVGVTPAYVDPAIGKAKVIDHWVLRITGAALTGHGWYTLEEKPDSVLMRYTFEGGRK